MKTIRVILSSLAIFCAGMAPDAARADDVVQKQYVLGADTPSRQLTYISCEQAPSIGGACFTPPPGASTVRFQIDDATTTHPGAQVRFLDSGGGRLAIDEICGSNPLAVPAATGRIQVFVNGPSTMCPGTTASGTVGTITATFTRGAPPEPGEGYVPSPPVHSVRAERKRYVPTGDTTVQVDVYRPDAPGRFPAIVWFDVYYKDDPGAVVNSERDYFVSRGYAFVHASSPGSNTSGGTYENAFGPAEQQAAYDVVEWAAAQEWSNGRVGMDGLSYAAIIQYFVAAMRPPHLVTIYPTSAYSDLYRDIVYTGGNLQAGYPIVWDANNRSTTFAPPTSVGDDPATQFTNYATTVAGARPILADFVQHPYADEFYVVRSPITRNVQIEVPAAIDVGWSDDMVYGGPINFESLGSSTKRMVIGPWGHSAAHRRPGGRDERLRWYDRYLKGMPSGVDTDDRVRVFIPRGGSDTEGRWVSSPTWPLPDAEHTSLYLGPNGSLSFAPPSSAGSASYTYSPTRHSSAAMDVSSGESLTFETEPLGSPLTVVGYSELEFEGATTAPDTSWNVAVYDVAPSGSATLLQRGWLRAAARELDESRSGPGRPYHTFQRDLPVPSGFVRYRVPIWPFANEFPAGHRLRVVLSDLPAGVGGAPAFMPVYPGTNTLRWGPASGSWARWRLQRQSPE